MADLENKKFKILSIRQKNYHQPSKRKTSKERI